MNMKKILTVLLACSFIFVFAACGANKEAEMQNRTELTEVDAQEFIKEVEQVNKNGKITAYHTVVNDPTNKVKDLLTGKKNKVHFVSNGDGTFQLYASIKDTLRYDGVANEPFEFYYTGEEYAEIYEKIRQQYPVGNFDLVKSIARVIGVPSLTLDPDFFKDVKVYQTENGGYHLEFTFDVTSLNNTVTATISFNKDKIAQWATIQEDATVTVGDNDEKQTRTIVTTLEFSKINQVPELTLPTWYEGMDESSKNTASETSGAASSKTQESSAASGESSSAE
ncbi:hypothetical protein [Candidatus Soleaferrea massiliensis]|uniref:hypothetical protein n=1 Tax=Candidatus Soleaferrea massiliensis TaxID=1470354 RepID=UPI00058D9D35|nr:hypothetical protein [Candidatus Soleaferrea massiliensis]